MIKMSYFALVATLLCGCTFKIDVGDIDICTPANIDGGMDIIEIDTIPPDVKRIYTADDNDSVSY